MNHGSGVPASRLDPLPPDGDDGRVDRAELADFLRRRRESLQSGDVGLTTGRRRRANGLRREEVAALAGMSPDYYARMEQSRGPRPSEQMVAALARALRLTLDERDHLFRLTGHHAPTRVRRSEHVSPPLLRVFDRLEDTPALIVSDLADTLVQNRVAKALLGDQIGYTGLARSAYYRWFTGSQERARYPERDHAHQSAVQAAGLRAALNVVGSDARAREIVTRLLAASPEPGRVGAARGRVAVRRAQDPRPPRTRRDRGRLPGPVHREPCADPARAHRRPGQRPDEKLRLLSVIGHEQFST